MLRALQVTKLTPIHRNQLFLQTVNIQEYTDNTYWE